jgi:hypothetical protein
VADWESRMKDTCTTRERVSREVVTVCDMMLAAHYIAEPSWLVAALNFPGICNSPIAQEALRRAATLSWRFGFPAVSHWLNSEILMKPGAAATDSPDHDALLSGSPGPVPL